MFLLLIALAAVAQNAAPVDAGHVRQAIEKSLPFLEQEGLAWEMKNCVSCHHGPWLMWSGYEAKKRGFSVNDASLAQVRAKALKAFLTHPKMQPTSRDNLTELPINIIYLTFGMAAAGEPDAETAKFFDKTAAKLLEQQKENGSWKVIIQKTDKEGKPVTFLQPPLIDTDDVTTLWALLILYSREPAGISKDALDKAKERGLKFLSDNPPSDNLQSLVLCILLQERLGKTDEMQKHVKELLALQRPDGGWSQTPKLKSDALGTGQALVALRTAGVTAKDPAIAKAWRYLIRSQKEDGSWFVVSRAYQAPPFSSYMGTAWATLGLVRTLPAK